MHKDAGIIVAVCVIAAIVGVWAYVLWPKGETAVIPEAPEGEEQEAPAETEVEFITLASGDHSGFTERKNYHYSDEAEFEKVWSQAHPDDPMPDVDFETEAVIALFSGERPSGGHSIRVERVVDSEDTETVYIVRSEPAPDCAVTLAITTPFAFVKVPMTDRILKSVERVEVVACS